MGHPVYYAELKPPYVHFLSSTFGRRPGGERYKQEGTACPLIVAWSRLLGRYLLFCLEKIAGERVRRGEENMAQT